MQNKSFRITSQTEAHQRITLKYLSPELTEGEIVELEAAATMLPAFDDDCPEMTGEQLSQFKQISVNHKAKEQSGV